jgi:hypothetical protein
MRSWERTGSNPCRIFLREQPLKAPLTGTGFSPAAPEGSPDRHWVFSRSTWLPVGNLLPGTGVSDGSQIVVVRWGDEGRAFAVDQVLGIEAPGEMAAFPDRAYAYTDVPIAGVRFWKNGPVLELDLSRLISLDSEG